MSDKMYEVMSYSVDYETDYAVGVCESLELAQKIAKSLQKKNDDNIDHWNKYACRCICNREAWATPDDPDAIAALKEMEAFDCPFKKNVHVGELLFENNESGGYEIWCDGKRWLCEGPGDLSYSVVERKILTEKDYEQIAEEARMGS